MYQMRISMYMCVRTKFNYMIHVDLHERLIMIKNYYFALFQLTSFVVLSSSLCKNKQLQVTYSRPRLTRNSQESTNCSSYLGIQISCGRVFLVFVQIKAIYILLFFSLIAQSMKSRIILKCE